MFGEPVFMLSLHAAQRIRADVQRVRRHVRTPRGHLGMFAAPPGCRPVRGRGVHHRRVLVHGVDVVRESRGDAGPRPDRHVRRHSPGRVPGFIVAQFAGAAVATLSFRWLVPGFPDR